MKKGLLIIRWGWTPTAGAWTQSQFGLTVEGLRAAAAALEAEARKDAPEEPAFFVEFYR